MELHCPRVHVRVYTRACGGRDGDCTEVLDVNLLSPRLSPGRVPPPPASASSAEKEAGGRTPEACPPPGKLACGAVPEAPGLLPRQLRCQRLCFLLVPSIWEAGRTPPRVCGKPDARCVHRSPPPPSSAAVSAETALCPGARPLPSPPPPRSCAVSPAASLGVIISSFSSQFKWQLEYLFLYLVYM